MSQPTAAGAIAAPVYDVDVVIVGAGLAGLAAAEVFEQNKMNYQIIEADRQVGGRAQSLNFHDQKIDVGAGWISGSDKKLNPISKIARQIGLKTEDDMGWWGSNRFRGSNGKSTGWDQSEVTSNMDKYWEMVEALREQCNLDVEDRDDAFDLSFAEFLTNYGLGEEGASELQAAVRYLMTKDYHGEPADKISLEWDICDAVLIEMGDEYQYVTDPRGMQAISDYILEGLKNAKITYEDSVVSVAIAEDGQSVTVKTQGGKSYTAKQALVTTSIGVLKSNSIKFTPAFNGKKQKALNDVRMSNQEKVFVKFDERTWPSVDEQAMPDWEDQDEGAKLFRTVLGGEKTWVTIDEVGPLDDSSTTLVFTVADDAARNLLNEKSSLGKNYLDDIVSKMQGQKKPDAAFVTKTSWGTDPKYLGSWPFAEKGKEYDAEAMQEPLKSDVEGAEDRIFFAGDAYHKYGGYMQGAYLSGQETAHKMSNAVAFMTSSAIAYLVLFTSTLF